MDDKSTIHPPTLNMSRVEPAVLGRHTRWLYGEPSLESMLHDPVVTAMMARDGVAAAEVVDLVARASVPLSP